jgi:hypothetical protein
MPRHADEVLRAKRGEMASTIEMARVSVDTGQLMQSGWLAFRTLVLADDTPATHVAEARLAFLIGAQYLFTTLKLLGIDGQIDDDLLARIEAELREGVVLLDEQIARKAGSV